jgi:GAF domain-containing protein
MSKSDAFENDLLLLLFVALEHQKLTQGGHADAQAAKAALDEQVQANIEKARGNEIAERDHAFKLSQAMRVVRTKDGLRLVFDETPGRPAGAAQ